MESRDGGAGPEQTSSVLAHWGNTRQPLFDCFGIPERLRGGPAAFYSTGTYLREGARDESR